MFALRFMISIVTIIFVLEIMIAGSVVIASRRAHDKISCLLRAASANTG